MVIIRNTTYSFPFAFRSNHGRIFSCFDTIHERDVQTPDDSERPRLCRASRGKKNALVAHCVHATVESRNSGTDRVTVMMMMMVVMMIR